MPAGKFKATCLALLDEVQTRREPVLVTKNGKPVAKLVPLDIPEDKDPLDALRFPGTVEIHGDIMAPIYTDEEYDQFFEEEAAKFR